MAQNHRFAQMRKAAGISQGRLAKLTGGLTQADVSQFELGNRDLRPEKVIALRTALQRELERRAREATQLADRFSRESGAVQATAC